jgi:hypothetical protein
MRSRFRQGKNGFGRRGIGDRVAVGGEDSAFEACGALRHLAPDPAVADDADGAAHHFAMRRPAAKLRARDPGPSTERRHRLEQAMGQNKHRHDDVFGNRWLVAEHVANRDALGDCLGVEEVESGRHGLQQAKARRGRERGPPDMPDDDLRFREQRRKVFRIALIIED